MVAKEVKRAMQQSAALVAASLERLQVAEAAWDRDVRLNGVAVDGFPTVEQVLTFMSRMSRERQRMCLAQRGDCRKGRQKIADPRISRHALELRARAQRLSRCT